MYFLNYVKILIFIFIITPLNSKELSLSESTSIELQLGEKYKNKQITIIDLSISPSNPNLIYYTFSVDNSSLKQIVLHNIKINKSFIIKNGNEPIFLKKNSSFAWHPSGKVLIFTSKISNNIERLFSLRIYQDNLSTRYSYKVFELVFIGASNEKAINRDPSFNKDGSILYFSRKDKNTNGFDIFYIEDFNEKLKEKKCGNLEFEVLVDNDFDQILPKPSPLDYEDDNQVVAYLSTEYDTRYTPKSKIQYIKYDLYLFDNEDEEEYKITSCSGFKPYPFFWSPNGESIYLLKAKRLKSTSPELMDKKLNMINLYNFKILKEDFSGFSFIPLTNGKTDILVHNVNERIHSLSFLVNNSSFLISSFNDKLKQSYSIKYFNSKKWINRENSFLEDLYSIQSVIPNIFNIDNTKENKFGIININDNKILKSILLLEK